MTAIELVFWWSAGVLVSAYAAYPAAAVLAARLVGSRAPSPPADLPHVTIVVPAYLEGAVLDEKLRSCAALDYPVGRVDVVVVTDVPDADTDRILARHPHVRHVRLPERRGKAAALNAAMPHVSTPVTVLTDADAMLAPEALGRLVPHITDGHAGAVSGEKRVRDAGSGGEGLYWRYESLLKRCDARILTVVGAAGELLAFRTELWEDLEEDTILDDFVMSMRWALAGHRIAYAPDAIVTERGPATFADEWERRVRIAAGGWQAMWRVRRAFLPVPRPLLCALFVAHRAVRWTLAPIAVFAGAAALAVLSVSDPRYAWPGAAAAALVACAVVAQLAPRSVVGRIGRPVRQLLLMHAAVPFGVVRLLAGRQAGAWRKTARA